MGSDHKWAVVIYANSSPDYIIKIIKSNFHRITIMSSSVVCQMGPRTSELTVPLKYTISCSCQPCMSIAMTVCMHQIWWTRQRANKSWLWYMSYSDPECLFSFDKIWAIMVWCGLNLSFANLFILISTCFLHFVITRHWCLVYNWYST